METDTLASSSLKANEGEYALLVINKEEHRFVQLKRKNKVKVGKTFVKVDALIGKPWGSMFEVEGYKSVTIFANLYFRGDFINTTEEHLKENDEFLSQLENTEVSEVESEETDGVQKVSSSKIEEMKEKGVSGQQIIKALVNGSATFQEKTRFSQQKYITKKKKKYFKIVKLERPTSYSICRAYYQSNAAKICYLRYDTLSLLLTNANLQAHSQIVVFEQCSGLITGAVAERLGGLGRVIALSEEVHPSTKCVQLYNFSKEIQDSIVHLQLKDVPTTISPGEDNKQLTASQQLLVNGSDGLIIVSRYEPKSVLKRLYPLLSLSRNVVIYCQYLQPLAECYQWLYEGGLAVNIELTETWNREYQVIASRTHPLMNMDNASGYLLSAIKVDPSSK